VARWLSRVLITLRTSVIFSFFAADDFVAVSAFGLVAISLNP